MNARPAHVETITVIRVERTVGRGTEGDPVRTVIELHVGDGSECFMQWDTMNGASHVTYVPTRRSMEGEG
jgi:hypothetical protein